MPMTLNPQEESELRQIAAENLQLREEVKKSVAELEHKNRELEIEAALEHVRTSAMAMKKPEDMLSICRVVFQQLESLGVKNIRNVQTIILNDPRSAFTNFEYFNLYDKEIIIEVPYDAHPIITDFVDRIRSSDVYFFFSKLEGESLTDWRQYLKTGQEKIDPRLESATALYYYMYSIGPGSLGVSTYDTPMPDEDVVVLNRFRNVFQLAYRRYTDIEQAEAQNREAQIQLGLERVRARTMAMQRSDELTEASAELYRQLTILGEPAQQLTIGIFNEADGVVEISATLQGNKLKQTIHHPISEPYLMQKMYDAWKAEKKTFILELRGEELKAYNQFRNQLVGENLFPVDLTPDSHRIITAANFSKGTLALATDEPRPAESLQLLERFAAVLDLTYTRFLDLKQAEAQAREAKIEAALERVRSRTMGMQKSEELKDVIQVVYGQFVLLNIHIEHTGFVMDYKARNDYDIWIADNLGVPSHLIISYFDCIYYNQFNEAKEKGFDFFSTNLDFEEKNKFYQKLIEFVPGLSEETKEFLFSIPGLAASTVLLDNVSLYIENFSGIPYSDEENAVLMRFGKVFQQTYTRFLDLQKAEVQAREAQIEASLERVRSRAMAMQKSEDLSEAVAIVFEELDKLNLGMLRCGIGILDKVNRTGDIWYTIKMETGSSSRVMPGESMDIHPMLQGAFEAWLQQKDFYYVLENEDLIQYYKALDSIDFVLPELQHAGSAKEGLRQYYYTTTFQCGGLFAFRESAFPEEAKAVMRRFADVFNLTYTRFLDLQKAEAQTKEAQIELALERVRARTMAMQRSDELAEAAQLLYHEFGTLGITTFTCGYQFIKEEQNIQSAWVVLPDGTLLPNFIDFPLTGDPILDDRYKAWKEQKPLHICEVKGEANKEHHHFLSNHVPTSVVDDFFSRIPDRIIFYSANFSNGYLFIISLEFFSPAEEQTVIRFAKVFEQTYTRFLDLQKAEAQTREAQIETGLERVRSRTMAMQSCDELAETAAVVLHELILLGIAPSRLYIAIIENDQTDVHFYLTSEEGGKDCSVYTAQIEKNITIRKMYNAWADHLSSISLSMEGDELTTYFNYLRDEVGVPFKSTQNPSRRVQTIAYFSQGYIGIASPDDPPEETKKLLERFAAVFNLTYTRFNDLKQAEKLAYQANLDLLLLKEEKARTELALAELKATQAQLIQSEKMASLGELTAGIAHEIQNPLNFVNNFSEVNAELIDELNDELTTGNLQLAKEIAGNIKDNEEKIIFHGKRADAIVKGMLQHSRTSTGAKEPTDINALADEYLRLAYHGLRAKDKTFNATIKTDFDESIGLINVVPQDIGRVFLNLITNAFYAVSTAPQPPEGGTPSAPKSPEGDFIFQPTVTVTTKRKSPSGDLGAEIRVKDNGPGIPKNVIDKIFQPFFTTKPTGQGTGLGLSLSYDIIKAHGGEVRVETKEGEGSEFIIILPIA